jgi:hypothetical protein
MRWPGQEFCAHIGEDWRLYPSISYRRETDGTGVHQTATDLHEESLDYMVDLHEKTRAGERKTIYARISFVY